MWMPGEAGTYPLLLLLLLLLLLVVVLLVVVLLLLLPLLLPPMVAMTLFGVCYLIVVVSGDVLLPFLPLLSSLSELVCVCGGGGGEGEH